MKYKKITNQQIQDEITPGYRPQILDVGMSVLPLTLLGDRDFELLTYLLVKEEIGLGIHKNVSEIYLMQGVSERGRDCVLHDNGIVCGLIQCKKYANRLTKPQVLKEIIKFIIFALQDSSILPNPDNFEYKIYVSNDLTEPAILMINSYGTKITDEITNGNIEKYTREIIEEYESFSEYRRNLPIIKISHLISKINVSYANLTDLSSRIYKQENILRMFFNIKTVIATEDADRLIRKALDDYGLKFLTDQDLKEIQNRINESVNEHRVHLGLVDFFGYSIEFFRQLTTEEIVKIINQAAELKNILHVKAQDFIVSEINKGFEKYIIVELLRTKKIHPFSTGIVRPYLFKRIYAATLLPNISHELLEKYFPGTLSSKDQLLKDISEELFGISDKIMNGDYSLFTGDENLVALKIKFYEHMHQGFINIGDARKQLSKDIDFIIPKLDVIEGEVKFLLSKTKTIIIKDEGYLNNRIQFERFIQTCKSLDINYQQGF